MKPITQFNHVDANKTAIMLDGLRFSYGRLAADVASLAAWLTGQGVVAGQRIGIFFGNPYWSWVCRFAALRMGLTQATLAARNFREQTAATGLFDVALGDFQRVDGTDIARQVIAFSPRTMAPFAEQFEVAAPARCQTDPLAEASATCLMLTSGTTGKSRVVALSAEVLRSRLAPLQSHQGLSAGTYLLSTAGSNTMPGFGYSLATWQAGGCVMFTTSRSGLRQLQTNLLVTTPAELQDLLNMGQEPWDNREGRKVIVAGGRLPVPVRDEALARVCCQVSLDYGATETNCTATGDASLLDRHPGAVGYAVKDAVIQVVDRNGHPQPPGKEGVVRTHTPYMVTEYAGAQTNNEDEIFRDGWFYPGDLGVMFEDGLLAITGRLSETLNVSGTKIPLLDFEASLKNLSAIRDSCAIALKLDDGDKLAFLVVCDDPVDLHALSEQIASRLPFQVRFNMLRVLEIPRNAMGKIPRNALSEAYTEIYRRETSRTMHERE